MSGAIIRVRGLVKRYGGRTALNGIDLDVQRGEFLGLLGPNGAGKTTLLSIITGVRKATAGTVHVQEHDIVAEPDHVHAMIGLVPQEIALYETLTARENLRYFGSMHGLDKSTITERSDALLERAGLKDRADERIGGWSGGMQRRLNLIAALLHRPDVLFLDEPTVGIDVQSRAATWDLLKEIHAGGTTVVYTSHHMEEAERLCTRVVIVDHGQVVGNIEAPGAEGAARLEETFLRITGKALRDN
ncbi:MAG: ABC transporter ATP-binding protein [Flavobacteriales bacterium]